MIVKIVHPKKGCVTAKEKIKNLVNYITNPADEDANEKCHGIYLVNSQSQGILEQFLAECYALCTLAKSRAQRVFDHYILSWPENETPSEREIRQIVQIWTSGINPAGLAISGLHVNTENLHLHFAIQRYTAFGRPALPDNHEKLYRLHALLFRIEDRFGFAHQVNPLIRQDEAGFYHINRSPRDVFTFRPKRPDLLPVIPKIPLPFVQKGAYYFLPNEQYPCMYEAGDRLVLLQWFRKEVVDAVRSQQCPVYNISALQPEVPLSDIPVPKPEPLPAHQKNIRRDFKKALSSTIGMKNQSAREEQVVRYLFDLGYEDAEILRCLEQASLLERDKLRQLRLTRMLQSAKRAVNRFRLMITHPHAFRFSGKERIERLVQRQEARKKAEAKAQKTRQTVSVGPHL